MAVLRGAGANKEGELCVQAIFLLLDILKKWAEDNKGTTVLSAAGAISFGCLILVNSLSWQIKPRAGRLL